MSRILIALAAAAALAGCNSASPTGSDALTTAAMAVGPDGRPAQFVTCGEMGWCMSRAEAICRGRAPVLLSTAQPTRDYMVTFRCS